MKNIPKERISRLDKLITYYINGSFGKKWIRIGVWAKVELEKILKENEQTNEDAERLNEHLGHGMGCISWYNPMRCDCGCQDARKAHEERIT